MREGKWADIIAVDGDLLRDVTTVEHVKFVMKGGEVVKNECGNSRQLPAVTNLIGLRPSLF